MRAGFWFGMVMVMFAVSGISLEITSKGEDSESGSGVLGLRGSCGASIKSGSRPVNGFLSAVWIA